MIRTIGSFGLAIFLFIACSTVPITGRKQVDLLPSTQMTSMASEQYSTFLNENPPLPSSNEQAQMVNNVGQKISVSVEKYLNNNGYKDMVETFDWKFNTVQNEAVNAWAMPGGRVVFYTGILDICEDEKGVAVVMAHEVAHAVAQHGNERMTQQMGVQAAGMSLQVLLNEKPQLTQQLALQAFGIGSQLGMLAYSRAHESEADEMGLIFMAMAGYNPREAPEFWQRMANQSGGGSPPEFLSTHPSHETRIEELNANMDEALKYYNPTQN